MNFKMMVRTQSNQVIRFVRSTFIFRQDVMDVHYFRIATYLTLLMVIGQAVFRLAVKMAIVVTTKPLTKDYSIAAFYRTYTEWILLAIMVVTEPFPLVRSITTWHRAFSWVNPIFSSALIILSIIMSTAKPFNEDLFLATYNGTNFHSSSIC